MTESETIKLATAIATRIKNTNNDHEVAVALADLFRLLGV